MVAGTMYEGIAAAFAYMGSSVALILFNKMALSVYEFPHVNIVILMQLILSSSLLMGMKRLSLITFYNKIKMPLEDDDEGRVPEEKDDPREKILISTQTLKQTFPLSLSYFMYLILGMFALRAVSIPMYTTLRRLSTFFVMVIEAAFLGTTYAGSVKMSVFFMIFGALLAGIKDLDSDYFGYVLVMAYNIATAVYVITIGRLGKVTGLNNWGLIFYNNILCTPLIISLTLYTGELTGVLSDFSFWFTQPGFVVRSATIPLSYLFFFSIYIYFSFQPLGCYDRISVLSLPVELCYLLEHIGEQPTHTVGDRAVQGFCHCGRWAATLWGRC